MRLPVNCGLSLLSFQIIYCETQLPTDQKLSSSTFLRYMFVCPSRPVTSPLLDHTNHTFLESLWLTHHPTQTHQTHHMAFWVSHSLLLSSFTNNLIILLDRGHLTLQNANPLSLQYLCKHPFGPIYFWTVKEKLIILMFQKIFSKWHYDCSLNRNKKMIFSPSDFPFLNTLSDFQPLVALLSNSCVFNDSPKNAPKSP